MLILKIRVKRLKKNKKNKKTAQKDGSWFLIPEMICTKNKIECKIGPMKRSDYTIFWKTKEKIVYFLVNDFVF